MIQRRISDSPRAGAAGEQGRPVEHDGQPGAALVGALHLRNHVLQEQEAAVVDAGQPGTEAAREALDGVLVLHGVGHHLPLDAERGVGQQVVEPLALVLVVVEAVAELDVGGLLALDQHVGAAGGVGLGVHLLAEHHQAGLRVEVAEMVLGHRQHPAGAARRVEQRLDHARLGEQLIVVSEQEVHHQPDHLSGGEVLAGGLVGELGELSDQLLVEVAHVEVGHRLGAQVEVGELRHHQVEQVAVVEPVDLHVEVELVDDVAGRLGEPRDVVAQVGGHVVGIAEQRGEGVLGGVEERLAGELGQQRIAVLERVGQPPHRSQHLLFGGLQHAVQPAQHRERKDDPAVLRLLVHPAQQVGHRPDERRVVVDRLASQPTSVSCIFC